MKGTLYVLPNIISPENLATMSLEALEILEELRHFAVENVKTTRRMLRSFGIETDFEECTFYPIHHKTDPTELSMNYGNAMNTLLSGQHVGILSEAGMAGIADPGSHLVAMAHKQGLAVKPITGPSSIFLALCASGFNGQKFTFHGYVPIEARHRKADLKAMEAEVKRSKTTQIFMETPYRNMQMLSAICEALHPDTLLCIACNISATNERIHTKKVSAWKKSRMEFNKQPCIFIIGES